MAKKRRLGRGLEALLNAGNTTDESSNESQTDDSGQATILKMPQADSDAKPTASTTRSGGSTSTDRNKLADSNQAPSDVQNLDGQVGLVTLDVRSIDENPFQPRRDFSEPELASLSESLKEHDMLQPVLVRRVDDRYQLISGERRWRAAIRAGLKTIPAQIREADDRLVAELAIVENLQRKDLNAIEKALSFRRYIDEHGCSQDLLAGRLKIDRSTIANLMRLLELPPVIQDVLQNDIISAGHARALLPLADEDAQISFCNRIQRDNWSVRETERQVRLSLEGDANKSPAKNVATKSKQIESLENEFRRALGTKVEIRQTGKGKGQIVMHFTSNAEFERLRSSITDDYARSKAG